MTDDQQPTEESPVHSLEETGSRAASSDQPVTADQEGSEDAPADATASIRDRLPADAGPIRLADVSKRYGDVVAVENASLEFHRGEVHCLAGPNGSGKTTLGKLVVGLSEPTAGRIAIPGDSVGFGFQQPRYYPELTVAENLDVFRRLVDLAPDDAWIETVQSLLRLDRVAHQPANQLSGGFEKKLDLAITLLNVPPYLWLDEPLSNVDEVSARRIVALLERYAAAGACVVLSTHNFDRFATLATHLTVFVDGRVIETVELDDGETASSIETLYRERVDRAVRRG